MSRKDQYQVEYQCKLWFIQVQGPLFTIFTQKTQQNSFFWKELQEVNVLCIYV